LAKVVVAPPANNRPTAMRDVRSMISEPESPAALNGCPASPVIEIWLVNMKCPVS
jgi:hypothetical protein